MESAAPRLCKVCGKELVRKDGEKCSSFKLRVTCDRKCSSQVYKPKRRGSDAFYKGLSWEG